MPTETKNNIAKLATFLTESIKGLKYIEGKGVFTFDRRQYKVVSIAEVGDELEVNFEAVAKSVAKKFSSVSYYKQKLVYDGFNDIAVRKCLPEPKIKGTGKGKPLATTELTPKQYYQQQYYLNHTKAKRAKLRMEKVKDPTLYECTCAICGNTFESTSRLSKYCSDPCKEEGKKRANAKNYQKFKKSKSTEEMKKFYASHKKRLDERMANDPEFAEKMKAKRKEYYAKYKERMVNDPEFAEKQHVRMREYIRKRRAQN